jgi:hypothetical protein
MYEKASGGKEVERALQERLVSSNLSMKKGGNSDERE